MDINIAGAAAVTETAVEAVMKVEPTVVAVASMFVPGAAPIAAMVQPWILFAVPYLERALNDVAQNKGGDLMDGLIELMQHISKNAPNSQALTPAA